MLAVCEAIDDFIPRPYFAQLLSPVFANTESKASDQKLEVGKALGCLGTKADNILILLGLQQLRGYISSLEFPFTVSISFPFSAFPYAQIGDCGFERKAPFATTSFKKRGWAYFRGCAYFQETMVLYRQG